MSIDLCARVIGVSFLFFNICGSVFWFHLIALFEYTNWMKKPKWWSNRSRYVMIRTSFFSPCLIRCLCAFVSRCRLVCAHIYNDRFTKLVALVQIERDQISTFSSLFVTRRLVLSKFIRGHSSFTKIHFSTHFFHKIMNQTTYDTNLIWATFEWRARERRKIDEGSKKCANLPRINHTQADWIEWVYGEAL